MKPSEITDKINKEYSELYRVTCQYVKEHQGEKGYIDTQNEECDYIYAMFYDMKFETCSEYRVKAVKYDEEQETLSIVCEDISFDDSDITEEDIKHATWFGIDAHNGIVYSNTLFSIAENIEEYVE